MDAQMDSIGKAKRPLSQIPSQLYCVETFYRTQPQQQIYKMFKKNFSEALKEYKHRLDSKDSFTVFSWKIREYRNSKIITKATSLKLKLS